MNRIAQLTELTQTFLFAQKFLYHFVLPFGSV
jgi:hypothetical protein